MHKLNTVYIALMNNMWDIENQLTMALPKLTEKAHHPEVKKVFQEHLDETYAQKIRIEELLQKHTESLTYERDLAFETLLKDAQSDLALIADPFVHDAFLIASAQMVEHIEKALYTTLVQWAKELGDTLAIGEFTKTLHEEESTIQKLTSLAEGGLFSEGINEKAAETGHTPHSPS